MTEYLRTRDVAERMNVPEDTLRRWRTRDEGPAFVRFNGSVRYKREDVEAFIAEAEAAARRTA